MTCTADISCAYNGHMETNTHHQVICNCGYKSRFYTNESKAWSIRDNHLWNVHSEYARSDRANVISSEIKKGGK